MSFGTVAAQNNFFRVKMVDRMFYNTVLTQTFSPCGKYLIAANLYGEFAVFDLASALQPPESCFSVNRRQRAHHIVKNHIDKQICSLVSTPNFLLSGSSGVISGWSWKQFLNREDVQPSFTIAVPNDESGLESTDVNCMLYNNKNEKLYAGCGNNKILVIDIENGKIVSTLSGHSDFVHCINAMDNQLASASEDGTVRLWDIRKAAVTNILTPHKEAKLARPSLGKWIGAVALNNDWLVCGGGPKLSLWHLRTLDVTKVFSLPDFNGVHVAKFHEDRIFTGGASPSFYQLSPTGHIFAEIPISATTVYSAEIQETPLKVLAIAGSSPNIDVCTNFCYADQVFTFSK